MLSHVVSHNTQTQLQWDTSGQPSPKNVLYSEHATCAFPRVPSNMETRAYPKASPNNVFSTCNVRSTKAPSKHEHALKRAGGQGWKGNVFNIATRPAFSPPPQGGGQPDHAYMLPITPPAHACDAFLTPAHVGPHTRHRHRLTVCATYGCGAGGGCRCRGWVQMPGVGAGAGGGCRCRRDAEPELPRPPRNTYVTPIREEPARGGSGWRGRSHAKVATLLTAQHPAAAVR